MTRRLVAALLFTVFLGAGTTLPGPDALLHHWRAQSEDLRPHVELPGGCGSHVEKCTLGRTAAGAGAALVEAPVLHTSPAGSDRPLICSVVRIVTTGRDGTPQSRAPPAPVA